MPEETKKKKFRATVRRLTEVEDKVYFWVDSVNRANLPVPPSIGILKAKQSSILQDYKA